MQVTKRILLSTAIASAIGQVYTADAIGAEQAGSLIDEIIVTAQRRSERIQDVPMSITAINSARLAEAGIENTQDIALVTPGLVTQISSSFFQPTIRGVGTRNNASGDEANVAMFFDGVYLPEQSATLFDLNSVERIEVLKGPQGTLFGRNATGGAISIVTKKPTAETEFKGSLSAGEDGYRKADVYVAGGLTESGTVLASLAAFKTEDDGYIDNVFLNDTQGENESSGARLKFLFQPSDTVEFQLNGFYTERDNNSAFSGQSFGGSSLTRLFNTPPTIPEDIAYPQNPRETATQFTPENTSRLYIVDAHAAVDLGFADLTGVVGYYNSSNHTMSDVDVSPYTFFVNEQWQYGEYFYEEMVLSSKDDGDLTWLAGLSFLQGKSDRDQLLNGSPSNRGMETDALAAFVEGTYALTDQLFLTLGGRYSEDEKDSYYSSPTLPERGGSETFSEFTPKAVLRYEFNPHTSVYASYTEGFKTGTFNTSSASAVDVPVESEIVKAFEVGIKGDLSENLLYSAAVFHYIYEDLQTQVVTDLGGGQFAVDLQNAPEAEVDGAEFSLTWMPTSQLSINAGLSLLNAEITDFPNASITEQRIVGGLPSGNINVSEDIEGYDLIRAPAWSANIGATYDVELDAGRLTLAGNALFSDKYYLESGNRIEQPAYEIVNGSISFSPSDTKLTFTVFGKNLTDEDYFQNATVSIVSDTVSYAKGRWFGATVSYEF